VSHEEETEKDKIRSKETSHQKEEAEDLFQYMEGNAFPFFLLFQILLSPGWARAHKSFVSLSL
jgi:hypothetical protein